MRRALLLALALAGCATTASQLREAGLWRDAAVASCKEPGKCAPELACVAAVYLVDQLGAGQRELAQARAACKPYGARP
jgi:hypothetical protein